MSALTLARYLRLSSEDKDLKQTGKAESNSIANQRNLLDDFIRRTPELAGASVLEFCDDGWSGKNFERPAVQEMLSLVRQGKIQCILVKDLSRFGRDYLTVGNYLSRVFPFMGVRFIAVNDGFDSIRPMDVDSLDTSFKALLYDLYSRELSRKVRSAKRFRAERGDFLAPFAPFGYAKDPANKNRLVVDPEAAAIVRRVFALVIDGWKTERIAKTFNEEHVPTPMLYKRAAGCSRTVWHSVQEDNFWTGNGIAKIIRDERYTGKNIYGKRMRDEVANVHTIKMSRSDWVVVEDTHEGIISREDFDRAQARLRDGTERTSGPLDANPLSRKVRCGICGHVMPRREAKQPYYLCRTPRLTPAYDCAGERILESDLMEILLEDLRMQARYAVEASRLWKEQRRQRRQGAEAVRKTLSALRESRERLAGRVKSLYEDFALGTISKEEYLTAKNSAAQKQQELDARIQAMEAELDNTGADGSLQNPFVEHFKPYTQVEQLTKEMATDLLQEVLVYPGPKLKIVWNYREDLHKLLLETAGEVQETDRL